MPIQNDGGANQYCANNKKLLIDFKEIDPYPIQGVEENTVAIHCTGICYLPWHCGNGETILIPCYYSPDVSGTIISPTDIVLKHKKRYCGWNMTTNIDTGVGEFYLTLRDGVNHTYFTCYMENGLWYHYL